MRAIEEYEVIGFGELMMEEPWLMDNMVEG